MRQLKHIIIASFFALAFLAVSCVDPFEPQADGHNTKLPENSLAISPQVLGIPLSKATIPGEDARDENKIVSLDVFVYRKTSSENVFYHRYTLTPEEGETTLSSGTDYLLESNWRTAKYPNDASGVGYEGNTFKIYVIANIGVNVRESAIPAAPTEAQLRALVSTSKQTISDSYDVVRLVNHKGPGDNDWYNPHIKDNLFLMDGMIDNWTPDVTSTVQYFTKEADKRFEIARAAAKFKVTLDFAPEFLATLGTADADKRNFTQITETWEGTNIKKTEVVLNIGNMQAKFANFMPATYDFDPKGFIPAADLKTFRDANLWNSEYRYDFSYRTPSTTSADGFKYPYVDTTYSYAFDWESGESAEKVPALAASIRYTTIVNHYNSEGEFVSSDESFETDYYRIPLVDVANTTSPVTEIKRNYFYQVTALIHSMGTSITDVEPTHVKLNYKVIPWAFNEATDVTEVEGAELLYFTADTTFFLRGENTQYVNLDYFTPKSEIMSGHYLYEPILSNVRVYYVPSAGDTTNINSTGNRPGTYSNANRTWTGSKQTSNETVTIQVIPTPDGGGQIRVSSIALANRAVKYIEFDASVTFQVPILDEHGEPTGNYNNVTVTHHYFIKHFPLDNIQSVAGLWSSRWDGNAATQYFRKKYTRQLTVTDEIDQATWAAGIGNNNNNRRNANSAENAVNGYYATGVDNTTTEVRTGTSVPRSSNPTITWSGTSSVTISYDGRNLSFNMPLGGLGGVTYDYVTYTYERYGQNNQRTGTTDFFKYSKYYHTTTTTETSYTTPTGDGWTWEWESCTQAQYNQTSEENRMMTQVPSTGSWAAFSPQKAGTVVDYNAGATSTNGRYYAKTYYNGLIYYLNTNGSRSNTDNGLSNYHMYVIQISKAEDGVQLGHPNINPTTHQSQDNVVSPAFMIASQLGAVQPFTNGQYAANHCATYMEVTAEGRRFINWRLPTPAEIAYIVKYQSNTSISGQGVFEPVITGRTYYTLNGQTTNSGYSGASGDNYVRCIRDLTPAEVAELNATGTITTATY